MVDTRDVKTVDGYILDNGTYSLSSNVLYSSLRQTYRGVCQPVSLNLYPSFIDPFNSRVVLPKVK